MTLEWIQKTRLANGYSLLRHTPRALKPLISSIGDEFLEETLWSPYAYVYCSGYSFTGMYHEPEWKDPFRLTKELNTVHLNRVECWKSQIERHPKNRHEGVEQKAHYCKKEVKIDPAWNGLQPVHWNDDGVGTNVGWSCRLHKRPKALHTIKIWRNLIHKLCTVQSGGKDTSFWKTADRNDVEN